MLMIMMMMMMVFLLIYICCTISPKGFLFKSIQSFKYII
jgi:hypothetical protein